MNKFCTVLLAICLPMVSSAMEWASGSWLWSSSELLSAGKSHVSLSRQSRSASQRLNEDGKPEIIGRSSRQITERNGRSYVREFKIQMDYERWSPTWAYGLNSDWTILATLPMTRIKSNISESISEPGVVGALARPNRDEAIKTFKDGSGVQIAEAGTYNNMRVGRFQFRSKHKLYRHKNVSATMFETVKFPTLEKTQVDFVAFTDPLPTGFGSALGVLLNADVTGRLDLILSSEYLYQFPDKVYGRQLDGLPTNDPVDRTPGSEFISRLGTEYEAKEHLTLSAGYSYQGKAADKYEELENLQEANPSEKHAVYVGLAYLPGLRNAKRLGQTGFSASMGYEALLQGENVEDSDTLNVEVQMTF